MVAAVTARRCKQPRNTTPQISRGVGFCLKNIVHVNKTKHRLCIVLAVKILNRGHAETHN